MMARSDQDEPAQDWHRVIGLSWMDRVYGLPFTVEQEKDVCTQQQFLDVVILRMDEGAKLPDDSPDGFGDLSAHDLITLKQCQESLDDTAAIEFLGHYNAYRKLVKVNRKTLLPHDRFRQFAACVRSPLGLLREPRLLPVRDGVYDLPIVGEVQVRLIVAHELPETPNNAFLHMFAAKDEQPSYGGVNFKRRSPDNSTFMNSLAARYDRKGWTMPYTMEQATRGLEEKVVRNLPEETKLKMVSELPPENVVGQISPEKRVDGLSLDDLLKALSPEAVEELRRRLGGK